MAIAVIATRARSASTDRTATTVPIERLAMRPKSAPRATPTRPSGRSAVTAARSPSAASSDGHRADPASYVRVTSSSRTRDGIDRPRDASRRAGHERRRPGGRCRPAADLKSAAGTPPPRRHLADSVSTATERTASAAVGTATRRRHGARRPAPQRHCAPTAARTSAHASGRRNLATSGPRTRRAVPAPDQSPYSWRTRSGVLDALDVGARLRERDRVDREAHAGGVGLREPLSTLVSPPL